MIVIKDLSVTISGQQILNDLSLNIPLGKWSALVGPNGAGKTTLLKVLLGATHYSGSATSLGREIYRDRSRNVAFVPQHHQIPQGITVAEYVALGRAKRDGWGRESWSSRNLVAELLESTELLDKQKEFVTRLSGGEMQRTVIARALAQEPDLILLDEPTSALDLHHQVSVLDRLQKLQRDGVTIVSTTHDITLGSMYADQIIVMKNGVILAEGPADGILHSAALREAFEDRISVFKVETGESVVVARREKL